jgi:hypothetical protein
LNRTGPDRTGPDRTVFKPLDTRHLKLIRHLSENHIIHLI